MRSLRVLGLEARAGSHQSPSPKIGLKSTGLSQNVAHAQKNITSSSDFQWRALAHCCAKVSERHTHLEPGMCGRIGKCNEARLS